MSPRYKFSPTHIAVVFLAVLLGYLVSTPDFYTFATLGLVLVVFSLPLLLKYHHALLIIFWNIAFTAFFLPGQPDFWLVFVALTMVIAVLNFIMFERRFLRVPELTVPLLFFAVIVIVTACYRGGAGIRALGGTTYGGKPYFYILGAILGYFGLTSEQVPLRKCQKMASLYFLSGTTNILSNVVYMMGPAFYFFYYLVPSGTADSQAANDSGATSIDRIEGIALASVSALCFLLARYGMKGLLDWTKPWRLFFLIVTLGASFFGGFRSVLVLLFLIFVIQFYLEGLMRTHYLALIIGLALCGIISLLVFSDRMPLAVQRTISFLPVSIDSEVRADAKSSTEWRLQMWSIVWKDVPKYLIIGKGYGIDPSDMFLTTEAIRMGILSSYEEALLAGDYHSGPLSVLVPFGALGMAVFMWTLAAGGWLLYSNYRNGRSSLRRANTVLFSYYLASVIAFFFVFGALSTQLYVFLGTIGLSISLNGGVRRKPRAKPISLFATQSLISELQ